MPLAAIALLPAAAQVFYDAGADRRQALREAQESMAAEYPSRSVTQGAHLFP